MDDVFGKLLGGLLVFGFFLVVIMLVCREVVCWYFKINQIVGLLTESRKINQIVGLLTESRDLLANKASSQNTTSPSLPVSRVPQIDSPKSCPGCGAAVVDAGSAFCIQCGSKI